MSEDLAWAAGLFEGEGYLIRRPVGNRIYMQFGLQMTDLDVVERFVAVMKANGGTRSKRAQGVQGAAVIGKRKRAESHHKECYHWNITGHHAAAAYLALRPWLGLRRRAKGDEILREAREVLANAHPIRNCEFCGTPFRVRDHGTTRRFCTKPCHARWKVRQPGGREKARERNRRYKERQRALRQSEQQLDLGIPGSNPLAALLRAER